MIKAILAFALYFTLFLQSASAEISFAKKLANAVIERIQHDVTYDGSYYSIKYPGGDVPENIGVCSVVIVGCYRVIGIDLQPAIHEDMKANLHLYPKKWGLKRVDTNSDHRHVPNLHETI